MNKLNIYETSRSGSVQGEKLWHESIAHNKFGRVIAPKTQEEDDDLKNGPGFGTAYWVISPEDLKGEADLRINKILSPAKVDLLFALPEKEQLVVIEMLNENFDSLISESLSSGNSEKSDDEKKTDDLGDENDDDKEPIPYDDIKVDELKEILKEANIPFDPKALKPELYKLVYPDSEVDPE